ncbi:uncharacterized protein METZ01_LOCUS171869 [marine metagenome]|uniref:Uncharacterized protein n=1 Tax=marine metagenome TaxID=408172 RepID=A0A382BYW3_9ZZZZ
MNPSDNKVFRRNTNITSIGLLHKNEGILLGGFLDSWMIDQFVFLKKIGNDSQMG